MSIFSLFSADKKQSEPKTVVVSNLQNEIDAKLNKEFFKKIVDDDDNMYLYFLSGKGWIGANKEFFKKLGLFDIKDFNREYDSIRDIFVNESEEIFTESDKSWLDYLRKYKKDGYRVSIKDRTVGDILVIDAFVTLAENSQSIYILKLKDVTKIYKSQQQAQEVEKLKSKFLANIGHEFRTPMNGIIGFLDLLKETKLDERQREYVNMISHSSKNLMTNIETLLDLSQLQSGRLELSNEHFNILPLVENLAYSYCKTGREKGIKAMTFIDPKLPQDIVGDSKKIMQVLNALISNAVKFTPRGGKITIEVKVLKKQQNGDCSIGFSIKDTGHGISEEQIALVNEPFTAGNHADERLGVGLSLAAGLVKLLGSELRITSDSEGTFVNFVLNFKNTHGQNYKMMPKKKVKVLLLDKEKIDEANFLTTYLRSFALDVVKSNILDEHIYEDIDMLYIVANQNDSSWILELGTYTKKIPVSILLNEGEKLQTKLSHIVDDVLYKPLFPSNVAEHLDRIGKVKLKNLTHTTPLGGQKSGVRALVVEDNLINQRLIKILLQEYNIEVFTAANGLEALDTFKQHPFNIVFMDIDMPQMNGIVATKEMKNMMQEKGMRTPVVALTAMAMDGDKEMLLAEGLDDYLSKPLTREKLEYILEKHIKVQA